MEFLKNHYEKVILSLVLLGLAVVAALLPLRVQENPGTVEPGTVKTNRPAPLETNLKTNALVVQEFNSYSNTVLSGVHNLFNPVAWFERPDKTLIKNDSGDQIGVQALKLVKVTPLYLILSLERVTGQGNNIQYQISTTREAHPNPRFRGRVIDSVPLQGKTEFYTLIEVKGPPADPTELVLELAGGKPATLRKGAPFRLEEAYMADFRYDPENFSWRNMREQARSTYESEYKLVIAGDTNIIVAINQTQAVLSAQSTTVRTTIKKQAAP